MSSIKKIHTWFCALPLICFIPVYIYKLASYILNSYTLPEDPKDSVIAVIYSPLLFIWLIGIIPLILNPLIMIFLHIQNKKQHLSRTSTILYLAGAVIFIEQFFYDTMFTLGWFVD